jgi:hypothetical protein
LNVRGLLLRARSDRLVDLERRDLRVPVLLGSVLFRGLGHGATLGRVRMAGVAPWPPTVREPDATFADPRQAVLYDFFNGDRSDLEAYVRIAHEVEAQRDAPDRPGTEMVFVAHTRDDGRTR